MLSCLSLSRSIGLGVVGWLGVSSCTLTSDSFEPLEVSTRLSPEAPAAGQRDAGQRDAGPRDAGAPSVAAPGEEPVAPCSRGEAAGCAIERLPGACSADADCESLHCLEGACQPATCADDRLNQDESAADCGGACAPCAAGERCRDGSDCASGVCGASGECSAASCADGVANGAEPVVDCGDATCGPCADGHACSADAQCASASCQGGTCRPPPCADGERNGSETDVDCGGSDSACARCVAGADCAADGDCRSGDCNGGVCSSCGDGERNGTETDVDCGGSCGPCQPGEACGVDADCQSVTCQEGRCCGGARADCTRCARRLARVLSCGSNGPNGAGQCDAFLDCLADNPDTCSVRHAPGCSEAPGGVCAHTAFGGNTGPGVALADAIIGTAGCTFGEE